MTAPRRRKNNLPNAVWYGLTVLVTTWIGYLAGSHRTLSSPPSAAVPAQPFRFLSEQAGEESPTNEDKDDSVLDPLNFLTIICIVLVLIALTLGFEFLKEHLEHSVEEECEIILEKFFGELTVLGFLAMVTFIFSQTGIADMLSERIFGEKKELLEYFELVHYALFFIMVFFTFQVLIMIHVAEKQQREWVELDERIRNEPPYQCLSDAERQTLSKLQQTSSVNLLLNRCFRETKRELQWQDEVVYRALRREFILDRSLDAPFAPTEGRKRVSHSFRFGRYLGLAQIHILSQSIEVERETWCFFGVMTIAYYLVGTLLEYKVEVLEWVWVMVGYAFYVGNFLFVEHLIKLRLKLLPKANDGAEFNETAELSLGSSPTEDLPAWCVENYRKALEKRHWIAKWLVGGTPNRQQIHFWMDRHGPHFYTTLLQTEMVFTGVYAGLLLIEFIPYVIRTKSFLVLILYIVGAVAPLIGIMFSKKTSVALMAQVSSIGTYRKDQIVRDVLLEQKTAHVVRTFLVIQHIRHVAEHGLPPMDQVIEAADSSRDQESEFSAMEIEEIGRIFDTFDQDGSGAISKEEFRGLLPRLGATMDENKIDEIFLRLDKDGDGNVSRFEFLHWYKRKSKQDHASPAEQARELFTILDDNESGEITLGEFKAKLDALNIGFSIDEIGALLNRLDHDSTGSINVHEFEHFVTKYYPKEQRASIRPSAGHSRAHH